MCGDWPDMYYGDIFSSQACLTGLFSKTQKPSLIFNQLGSLQERFNRYADFSVVDLSKQDWATAWTESEWDQLLSLFEAIPNIHLSIFNVSTSSFSPLSLSHQKMRRLATFMRRVPIDGLDVTRQNLNLDNVNTLFSGLVNNTALNDLRFSSTTSGDEAACKLSDILPITRIRTLITGYNNLTDYGIGCYTTALPKTQIHTFYAPGNCISERGMLPFVRNLSKTKVRNLDVSDTALSTDTADSLGQQMSTLSSLHLSNCQLNDKHMSNWPVYAAKSTTEVYDLSGNLITGKIMTSFIASLPANLNLTINLAGMVYLNDDDCQEIGRLLPTKNFHTLDISSNRLSCVGFSAMTVNTSRLSTLIAANNQVDDTCMSVFSHSLTAQGNSLRRLDLSNNGISSSGARQLLARVSDSQLRVLNLAGNQLTGTEFRDYPQAISQSQLTELNLAQNPIFREWLPQLLNAMLINTSLQKLDLSDIALTEANGLLLALHLLPPIPHPDSLSDTTLTRDQQRWLHGIQTRRDNNTDIKALTLRNTQLGEKGVRALCHAAPTAHLTMLDLSGNLPDASLENIHHCQISAASRVEPGRIFYMPAYLYQSLKETVIGMKLFSKNIVAEPAVAQTHNTIDFVTPYSTVAKPLGSFTNNVNVFSNQSFLATASTKNAANNMAIPTLLLAGTLLAWGVKRLMPRWNQNSPLVNADNQQLKPVVNLPKVSLSSVHRI